jgi:hypothetical protein
MPRDRTIFLAGKPGNSCAYIGAVANVSVSIGEINAKRDPGDRVGVFWSAPASDGLDRKIMQALAHLRLPPGNWHKLHDLDDAIQALDRVMSCERNLVAHEEARKLHNEACDAAYDARENALEDLRDVDGIKRGVNLKRLFETLHNAPMPSAPLPSVPEAIAAPRAAIVHLIHAHAELVSQQPVQSMLQVPAPPEEDARDD